MKRREFTAAFGTGLAGLLSAGALSDDQRTTATNDRNQHQNQINQLMGQRTPNHDLYKPATGEGTPEKPVTDELNANWDVVDANLGGSGNDIIVGSTDALEVAFDNLSRGDSIFLEQPAQPYRPSGWMDIDVSGVAVIAASKYAKNGQPIITMADGSNTGGIRVGSNSPVENIHIENVGYDGNYQNTGDGPFHHAFKLENVNSCRVTRCYAQHIGLHHVHGSGGSGITAHHQCREISIDNNHIHDTGDRGIQVSGENIWIINNRTTSGYDRSISLDVQEDGTTNRSAENVLVAGNVCHNNGSGSIIGTAIRASGNTPVRNFVIVNNVGYGPHRALVRIRPGLDNTTRHRENIVIANNAGMGGGSDGIALNDNFGQLRNVVVANNQLTGYARKGIRAPANVKDASITGNVVRDSGEEGIRAQGTNITVSGNTVANAGGHGIYSPTGSVTITGNAVRGVSQTGIRVTGDGGHRAVVSNAINGGSVGVHIGSSHTICGFNNIWATGPNAIEDASTQSVIVGNIAQGNIQSPAGSSESVANISY